MSLPDDLLEQSRFLATHENRKPRQATLRRAVSTAYYAVFHLLSKEAAVQASANTPLQLDKTIQRALKHYTMKSAAVSFKATQLPKNLEGLITTIPDELRSVANLFIELQEERENADYDLSINYDRAKVLTFIDKAYKLFAAWQRIRNTDAARVFLAALMFSAMWRNKEK